MFKFLNTVYVEVERGNKEKLVVFISKHNELYYTLNDLDNYTEFYIHSDRVFENKFIRELKLFLENLK